MAVERAPQLDGTPRRIRQTQTTTAAFPRDSLVGDVVVLGSPTERLGRDLLQFLFRIHPRRVCRTSHRMGRLTTPLAACRWQVLGGIAPRDVTLLPWDADYLRGNAMDIEHRLGAEIAD